MKNLNPKKWLGAQESVDIQYKFWIITHFDYAENRKYLNHMCSRNRKQVEFGNAGSLACVSEPDLKCGHCKRVPPKQIKNAFRLLENYEYKYDS